MQRTQIYLSKEQQDSLDSLSSESGNSKSEMIRQAIDLFIRQKKKEVAFSKMNGVFGIWKDRSESEFQELRGEWDRVSK